MLVRNAASSSSDSFVRCIDSLSQVQIKAEWHRNFAKLSLHYQAVLAQSWSAIVVDEREAHQQEAKARCAAVVKFENLFVLPLRHRSLSLKGKAGHNLLTFITDSRGTAKHGKAPCHYEMVDEGYMQC